MKVSIDSVDLSSLLRAVNRCKGELVEWADTEHKREILRAFIATYFHCMHHFDEFSKDEDSVQSLAGLLTGAVGVMLALRRGESAEWTSLYESYMKVKEKI